MRCTWVPRSQEAAPPSRTAVSDDVVCFHVRLRKRSLALSFFLSFFFSFFSFSATSPVHGASAVSRKTTTSSLFGLIREGSTVDNLRPSVLQVLYVLRAPSIGGHRNWFCRKTMLPFGSHPAPLYRGSRQEGHLTNHGNQYSSHDWYELLQGYLAHKKMPNLPGPPRTLGIGLR